MTQRGGMGREVGGGFRIENMCTPVVNSCFQPLVTLIRQSCAVLVL